jgi:autophagy-related protein 5
MEKKLKPILHGNFYFKLMVPRQTYFPMVTDKVQRFFSDYVISSNKNNQIWLDYNGTPLKWYFNIELLF